MATLKPQDHDNLRKLARTIGIELSDKLIELGDVLATISYHQLHHLWGYKTWIDYVESEVGVSCATSYDAIRVARWIRDERLTKAQRRLVVGLGRCKSVIMAGAANRHNFDMWHGLARRHTVAQLRSLARGESVANASKIVGVCMDRSQRRTMYDALKLARDVNDVQFNGETLAAVCEYYIKHHRVRKARKKAS